MLTEKLLIVAASAGLRRMLRLTLGYGKYHMHETETVHGAYLMSRVLAPKAIIIGRTGAGDMELAALRDELCRIPALAGTRVIVLAPSWPNRDAVEAASIETNGDIPVCFGQGDLIGLIEGCTASESSMPEGGHYMNRIAPAANYA